MSLTSNQKAFTLITVIILLLVVGLGSNYKTFQTQKVSSEKSTSPFTTAYMCAEGTHATVYYDTDEAGKPRASFSSDVYKTGPLPEGSVASSVLYTNGEFIWWKKGATGFLTVANKEQTPLVSDCVETIQ